MTYILIGLALIGFLPMAIILYRKRKNDRLKKTGVTTTGIVKNVHGFSARSINLVEVEYRVNETGEMISKNLRVAGLPYTVGDELPMIYDPKNPKRMQLDFKKKDFIPMLIFTIIIAGAVLFAC